MIDRLIVWPPKCPKISNKWSHVEMYVHYLTGHVGGYFSVDLNNNLSSYPFVRLKIFFFAKIHIPTARFEVSATRHEQDDLLKVEVWIWMWKKDDLMDS